MKLLGRDLASVLSVFAVLAAVGLAFPFNAIGFVPRSDSERRGSFAAFVTLSDEEHAAAMRAAKTSWQGDTRGVRLLRVDLSVGVLPGDTRLNSLDVGLRPQRPTLPRISYEPGPSPVSAAALPGARLEKGSDAAARPPFSKTELLKIE